MNIAKKIYCRTLQAMFRIAMPFLPYRKPKRLNTMEEVAELLKQRRIKSAMLVTGKIVRGNGLTKHLENVCAKSGIVVTIYDNTACNPTTDNIEEALHLYQKADCECLIGFGGGSVMDCAKAIGARVAKPKKCLSKMEGVLKIREQLPLLIAVPTTAGSGSETTLAAVVTDSKTKHKYPINDFALIPHYAVLDPQVTRSLSPMLTATTGLDALTHAVEAYIGRSTTKGTRRDSMRAVRLIFDNVRTACEDGTNMKARKKMLYASYLAGAAFTKSCVGYVHAVAHSLGGTYNISHGLANAVLLPYVLEAYGESAQKKLHRLACVAGLASPEDGEADGAAAFIEGVRQLEKDLGIGDKLKGIRKEDIPQMAKTAEREANPLYPVPKLMTAKELEQFYYDVME